MTTEYTFIAAPYLDQSKADADYEALRRLLDDPDSPDAFDCVTLGRKASGEVRFHRERDRDRSTGPAAEPSRSLAVGLAVALFPSVAGDIPASRVRERETLGAVAGVVAGALGRVGLHELGRSLDSSAAGLIAVTTSAGEDSVRSALTNAQSSMSCSASIDVDAVERAARLIAARHRPRDADR